MNSEDQESFCMVYRGFDPTEAGMLARMLEAEGITCRHVGTQNPAFIGVGELGCEQRLEVPQADEARARELLDASSGASADAPEPPG
jgi:Putative prokaryotic signal transducing protein